MRTNSATKVAEITPNDSATLSLRGIFVGGAGDVEFVDDDGNAATFTCVAGNILPVAGGACKVMATGTTATALVALQDL